MRQVRQCEVGDFVIRKRWKYTGKYELSRHRIAAIGKTRITLDDENRTQFTMSGKRFGATTHYDDFIEPETPKCLEELAMQELAKRLENLRKSVATLAARAGEETILKAIAVLRSDPAHRDPDDPSASRCGFNRRNDDES